MACFCLRLGPRAALITAAFLGACKSRTPIAPSPDNLTQTATPEEFYNRPDNLVVQDTKSISGDPKVGELSHSIQKNPFDGCGYASHAAGDNVQVAAVRLSSPESIVRHPKATIKGSGSLSFSGKQSALEMSTVFSVIAVTPNVAKNAARKLAEKMSQATIFKNLGQAESQAFLAQGAGQVVCGFILTTAQKSKSADNATYVNATFSKPIITMINPLLSVERIKLQLKNPIKISGIDLTIATNDSDVKNSGLLKVGTSEIALIPANNSLRDSLGKDVRISSEIAFRITNRFTSKGAGSTGSSPLDQIAEYYISEHRITHAVVKTPRAELPIIIYYD